MGFSFDGFTQSLIPTHLCNLNCVKQRVSMFDIDGLGQVSAPLGGDREKESRHSTEHAMINQLKGHKIILQAPRRG